MGVKTGSGFAAAKFVSFVSMAVEVDVNVEASVAGCVWNLVLGVIEVRLVVDFPKDMTYFLTVDGDLELPWSFPVTRRPVFGSSPKVVFPFGGQ